ncbi:MAG: class I SAM-dependent methyltransferase [Saprospiraceae bacterium]|nr:class I SAM-dependent methyltransferase [Saprospiraceae bacterium]
MINFIEKLIPSIIKRKAHQYILNKIRSNNLLISKEIPKINLQNQHLVNAKLLANREALLALLPKEGVVAELGVDEGKFSEKIIEICKPKTLHLVDVWDTARFSQVKKEQVAAKFAKEINEGSVQIQVGLSTKVVEQFKDEYFDWIFIDTDHSYKTTLEELNLWSKKVKPNGIIVCHDFIVGNWNAMIRYGVREAVYEFCTNHHWEIIFVTMEIDYHPSVAIRKAR